MQISEDPHKCRNLDDDETILYEAQEIPFENICMSNDYENNRAKLSTTVCC